MTTTDCPRVHCSDCPDRRMVEKSLRTVSTNRRGIFSPQKVQEIEFNQVRNQIECSVKDDLIAN